MEDKNTRWSVDITRVDTKTESFDVLASSKEEAEEKALEEAYNLVFRCGSAEYEVDDVRKMDV
jgi:hypothetical protein